MLFGLFIVYCLNVFRGEFLYMLFGVFFVVFVLFVVVVLIMKFIKEFK